MIFDQIQKCPSQDIALQTHNDSVSYGELVAQVNKLAQWLISNNIKSVALLCDNLPQWLVIDLACQSNDIIFTPIPTFFSAQQISHLIARVKPTILFSDRNLSDELLQQETSISPIPCFKLYKALNDDLIDVPNNTSKITFTSGSTGEPKGVCLSIENQSKVALSLVDIIDISKPKHLCLLPYATLLENVAGLYAPLLAGGTVYVATDDERGFNGAQLTNIDKLLTLISTTKPQTMILVPELLQVLLLGIKQGWRPPIELQFIAVGGSRISDKLLANAKQLGLPVFQGYGLSECGSVVSINTANESLSQGAGKILPHLTVEIINDELIVSGNSFLGYLNNRDSWNQTKIYTGDLVEMIDGNIEIKGRKKNLLINSYGRNISPEWLESELMSSGVFKQVVVFGDNRPFCIAIIVPISADISSLQIVSAIDEVNQNLPCYAQIEDHINLSQPMLFIDGLFTSNGCPKRDVIEKHYFEDINEKYNTSLQVTNY